jgi:hypothetical protein
MRPERHRATVARRAAGAPLPLASARCIADPSALAAPCRESLRTRPARATRCRRIVRGPDLAGPADLAAALDVCTLGGTRRPMAIARHGRRLRRGGGRSLRGGPTRPRRSRRIRRRMLAAPRASPRAPPVPSPMASLAPALASARPLMSQRPSSSSPSSLRALNRIAGRAATTVDRASVLQPSATMPVNAARQPR